jgi:hypothetical protein
MKNVFTNNITPLGQTYIPSIESADFELLSTVIESLCIMEDQALNITKDQIRSRHYAVRESNYELITEGFGDFIKGCVNFFKSMMARLQELFSKILMFLRSYYMNFDKFLTKYKTVIESKDPKFTVKGFHYSFKASIPSIEFILHYVSSYNNELREVQSGGRAKLVELRTDYASTAYYNRTRGMCLGRMNEISSEKYHEELKKEFRSNKEEPIDIEVNGLLVRNYISEYTKSKKILDEIKEEKNKLDRMFSDLSQFFSNGPQDYYVGKERVIGTDTLKSSSDHEIDTDERSTVKFEIKKMEDLQSFYQYKFGQAREFSSITLLAFSAKVDALKEALKLYQKVIRESLFK